LCVYIIAYFGGPPIFFFWLRYCLWKITLKFY